jgi:hypothetical protein
MQGIRAMFLGVFWAIPYFYATNTRRSIEQGFPSRNHPIDRSSEWLRSTWTALMILDGVFATYVYR